MNLIMVHTGHNKSILHGAQFTYCLFSQKCLKELEHCAQHFLFFGPMPPHVLVDFVVLPPGHGRSATDF